MLQSIVEGRQGRNSSQELKPKVWKNAACWIALSGLLSYHSLSAQVYLPMDAITDPGLCPPAQASNLTGSVLQLSFLLPRCVKWTKLSHCYIPGRSN